MDQGRQRGGIKHSLSYPALTGPESKCPWVPGHPQKLIHYLENGTFEQQKRKQLEESPRKPGYVVPCLLWLPGLPWLHLDLDSPAGAAEVEGTLRKPCYATLCNQSMP